MLGLVSSLREFEEFVAAGDEQSLTEFYRNGWQRPFLGSEAFLAQALTRVRFSKEHPRAHRAPQFPTIEAVVRIVSERTGVTPDQILQRRPGRPNIPRNLVLYVASRVAGFTNEEICRVFALTRPSAVSQACQTTRAILTQNPKLQAFVDECTGPVSDAATPPALAKPAVRELPQMKT